MGCKVPTALQLSLCMCVMLLKITPKSDLLLPFPWLNNFKCQMSMTHLTVQYNMGKIIFEVLEVNQGNRGADSQDPSRKTVLFGTCLMYIGIRIILYPAFQ